MPEYLRRPRTEALRYDFTCIVPDNKAIASALSHTRCAKRKLPLLSRPSHLGLYAAYL